VEKHSFYHDENKREVDEHEQASHSLALYRAFSAVASGTLVKDDTQNLLRREAQNKWS
jgi:hypothetical protein